MNVIVFIYLFIYYVNKLSNNNIRKYLTAIYQHFILFNWQISLEFVISSKASGARPKITVWKFSMITNESKQRVKSVMLI